MAAPFDETGTGAPLNAADIGHGQQVTDGRPEASSSRARERPSALGAAQVDLQRLLPSRSKRLMFVPRSGLARTTSDASASETASHRDRASHEETFTEGLHADPALGQRRVAPSQSDALRDTAYEQPLPPVVRRVAVLGMKRTATAATAECYGVFVYDADGGEHPFMHFDDAASATYAALRIGQTYRVGVEFSNFSDPKALRPLHD